MSRNTQRTELRRLDNFYRFGANFLAGKGDYGRAFFNGTVLRNCYQKVRFAFPDFFCYCNPIFRFVICEGNICRNNQGFGRSCGSKIEPVLRDFKIAFHDRAGVGGLIYREPHIHGHRIAFFVCKNNCYLVLGNRCRGRYIYGTGGGCRCRYTGIPSGAAKHLYGGFFGTFNFVSYSDTLPRPNDCFVTFEDKVQRLVLLNCNLSTARESNYHLRIIFCNTGYQIFISIIEWFETITSIYRNLQNAVGDRELRKRIFGGDFCPLTFAAGKPGTAGHPIVPAAVFTNLDVGFAVIEGDFPGIFENRLEAGDGAIFIYWFEVQEGVVALRSPYQGCQCFGVLSKSPALLAKSFQSLGIIYFRFVFFTRYGR